MLRLSFVSVIILFDGPPVCIIDSCKCSLLSLPVSTTHAKTTAIMGVGAVKSIKAINLGVVKEMCLTWVLTFPGCGLISFLMTKLFMWLFL